MISQIPAFRAFYFLNLCFRQSLLRLIYGPIIAPGAARFFFHDLFLFKKQPCRRKNGPYGCFFGGNWHLPFFSALRCFFQRKFRLFYQQVCRAFGRFTTDPARITLYGKTKTFPDTGSSPWLRCSTFPPFWPAKQWPPFSRIEHPSSFCLLSEHTKESFYISCQDVAMRPISSNAAFAFSS